MERGFKYRIYPNESQRDQIARTLGCCRFVYNRALDVKKSAYAKTGKTVSWAELSRMLPAWKRDPDTSWLAQVDSMALQQSIRDLDRAYKNFFRRVREGGKPGFPKFKSRRHARQSYRTNGGKVLDRNHIALPKLGTVRAKVSRPLQGRFMSVTVSLDAAGRYFATFLCTDVPSKDTTATDREVGIDLGVETLATLSDGTKIENPRHLKKYERKLAREQRRLSRRKGARRGEKPSGRYMKQRKRISRIHAKIADARTDALHKVTTMLADENQVLCMEDLNAKTFAAGQLYVGLSRCSNIEGLTIFPKMEKNRLHASREVIDFYARMEKKASEGTVQLECPQRFSEQVKAYIADLLEKEKAAEKQTAPVSSAAEEALPWEREDAPGRGYQSTWNQF